MSEATGEVPPSNGLLNSSGWFRVSQDERVNIPLHKISVQEKKRLMKALVEDLNHTRENAGPPTWHEAELKKREALASSGKNKFTDWEVAKKQLLRKLEAEQKPRSKAPRSTKIIGPSRRLGTIQSRWLSRSDGDTTGKK